SSRPLRSTMRTFGRPSGSTVASAIALGSLISLAVASSSHDRNRLKGSDSSVKSPVVKDGSLINNLEGRWFGRLPIGAIGASTTFHEMCDATGAPARRGGVHS